MKVMVALNELSGLFSSGLIIGKITVANPIYGLGVQASNEELAYNFTELCKKILSDTPLKRLRTSSIEINEVDDEFIQFAEQNPRKDTCMAALVKDYKGLGSFSSSGHLILESNIDLLKHVRNDNYLPR